MKQNKVESFFDNRGHLMFASPKTLDFDYKYLTMGTVNQGCKRGGHYHKRIEEKLLLLSGKLIFDLDGEVIKMEAGDIIDIPVGATHTILNVEKETATFIEFKDEEFNPDDKDIFVD